MKLMVGVVVGAVEKSPNLLTAHCTHCKCKKGFKQNQIMSTSNAIALYSFMVEALRCAEKLNLGNFLLLTKFHC